MRQCRVAPTWKSPSACRSYVVRILVITGAGVSAESGIPTFRGKDGYWRNLDPKKLATPEAFARDPQLVWEWYRERRERIRNAQPNAAHEAIARLAHHTEEFLLVTQNVDDIHKRGGLPPEKTVQIHGDIFTTWCSRCNVRSTDRNIRSTSPTGATHTQLDGLKPSNFPSVSDEERSPRCRGCGAFMRPGVVWFGESLPWEQVQRVQNFLDRGACDVVIVAGTTATFGYIVDWALQARALHGELIEVNPEETPISQFATRLVREPAAIALPRIVNAIVSYSHG